MQGIILFVVVSGTEQLVSHNNFLSPSRKNYALWNVRVSCVAWFYNFPSNPLKSLFAPLEEPAKACNRFEARETFPLQHRSQAFVMIHTFSSFTRDWLKTVPATVETPVAENERALQPKHFYSRLGPF